MISRSRLQIIGAVALGAAFAVSAHAADSTKQKEPASVSESAPDKTGQASKKGNGSAGGTSVMPGKGPASVSESAPSKTGKEPAAAAPQSDSGKMASPKTPSSVSESAPDKTAGDKSPQGKGGGMKKDSEGMAR